MKKLAFLFVTLMTVVTACKDKDNTTPDNSKKYLKKVISVEAGVTTIYNLTYDAQHRILTSDREDGVETRHFAYNDKGLLSTVTLKQDKDHDIYAFTYNAAGEPQTGSHEIYMEGALAATENYQYTLANGKVTQIRSVTVTPEGEDVTIYKLSYTGANFTKMISEGAAGEVIVTLTYGNKKSPYAGFLMKYALVPSLAFELYSPNEMLTMNFDYVGGGPNFASTVTYTYGADGFPTKSITKFDDNTPDGDVTATFEY
ncbi:hypothetical protein GFS24_08560 [Chitinophaga sp. SYP-B3965]|uniref:hypothetical protein n=1 Tax=Chitinophaga sp. SYP-B3965 TaxID=2663120 RepID=UPI001299B7B6|nr:hypothetical protein [Chitinophaga sp. SYP-B3965]MRG45164.1 hypothetical protein [Chitinophaga sp. SYP-B3965]